MHKAGSCRRIWDTFSLVHKLKGDDGEITGSDQRFITTVLGEGRHPTWDRGLYDWFDIERLGGVPKDACIVAISGMQRDASVLSKDHDWIREHWV